MSILAKQYIEQMRTLSTDAKHITDILPHYFLHLGLIALLFPNARVAHCRRDLANTCLPCYFENFGGKHTYITDLRILAAYYRPYERLMSHWKKVLPIPVLDFSYEELIADQSGITR